MHTQYRYLLIDVACAVKSDGIVSARAISKKAISKKAVTKRAIKRHGNCE